jgi:ribosomal protein S18 acetylase RimI-like enzyme
VARTRIVFSDLGIMEFRQLREPDHGGVVAVVDDWWGGHRVAEKLPRLFFGYFAGTGFAVELVAFLVGLVGSPAHEGYVHFVGVRPDHRSRGLGRELYGEFFEGARRRGYRTVRAITSRSTRAPSASTRAGASRCWKGMARQAA